MPKIDLASGNANVIAISRVRRSSGFSPKIALWLNLPKGMALRRMDV